MTIVAALKKTTLAIKEWVATKVPTEDINANTAARHTHDNKDVLDQITGFYDPDLADSPSNGLLTGNVFNYMISIYQMAFSQEMTKLSDRITALENAQSS